MNILKLIEQHMISKNISDHLPEIRYFDGIEQFCTASGKYKGNTLEKSLTLYYYELIGEEIKDIHTV